MACIDPCLKIRRPVRLRALAAFNAFLFERTRDYGWVALIKKSLEN
jgi:hypothetical protein